MTSSFSRSVTIMQLKAQSSAIGCQFFPSDVGMIKIVMADTSRKGVPAEGQSA